ncbi:predicted protein [Uncinocarpus reesii 1704]|uniref:VOC domain-containing protein n=1 Tax=Uncinocarpus reesii (strain UAMH 1704) TaxID=336963 RepID=C4JWU0_UNCRE|nr:uncharacterized protein UREG_06113 [Uncinocarpus reesii 1704]EEP81248.1 predicted protein [Uncinocarpus reesii 1704]
MPVPPRTEAQLAAEKGNPCNETVAFFKYPEEKLSQLGGGLSLVSEEAMQRCNHGDGSANSNNLKGVRPGITLFYIVEDLEECMNSIVANGGKKLSGEFPEGAHGKIMYAEDSEGNRLGIYEVIGSCS